jgi:cell division cycle protein 20 (cofactor of APC complex)
LKWSYDGSTLASGGNENFLCLWDASMSSSRSRHPSNNNYHNDTTATTVSARVILTHHKAAVKALAWCPFHRGVLASGGGTADVSIHNKQFWRLISLALLLCGVITHFFALNSFFPLVSLHNSDPLNFGIRTLVHY